MGEFDDFISKVKNYTQKIKKFVLASAIGLKNLFSSSEYK